MAKQEEGAIVWYREAAGRGMVRLLSGKRYPFTRIEGVREPVANLRVIVRVEEIDGKPEVTVLGIPGGAREFIAPPEATRPATPARRKPAASTGAATKKKAAPKAKKTTATGKARKLSRKPDGSYPVGMSVLHPNWGQGFVVMSSPKVARVRFMPAEEERTVRVPDLSPLE